MKTVVLLFTYKRSEHTKKVIDALRKNKVLPQKLLIFQDGLKQGDNYDEWKKVNNLFHGINWCEKEIIVSDYNRGLASSIVSGINYAFKDSDTVIVLEDDCVPTANFIGFMNQCFKKYKDDRQIYSVSGYSWPIELEKDCYDVYGCGRISTWGWGTWRNRWEEYKIDYDILKRLKLDKVKSQNLALWGRDIEQMLIKNLIGENDSWAVYWGLHVIEKVGVCIVPYHSMIQNIGLDGTGVHCGITDKFQVEILEKQKDTFNLPEVVSTLDSTKRAFVDLFGSYTALDSTITKEKVYVYGLGQFYLQNEKEINDTFDIVKFIDQKKQGWFAGKEIIKLNRIEKKLENRIIIMIQDIQECINIAKVLIAMGIDYRRIVLGHSFWGRYSECFEDISVLENGGLYVKKGEISLKVQSVDEFNNVYEVLIENIYQYFVNNTKQDVVIDIGMNIGDSALYFLNDKKVEKVYGYEPFRKTFLLAKENLHKYLSSSKRIEMFQYGISGCAGRYIVGFNSDMSCGQSTIESARDKAYESYLHMKIVKPEKEEKEQIEIKKASDEFKPIIRKHQANNIILKMDCEGEEYSIIEDLSKERMLDKFSFIMLEWHYRGKEILLQYLEKNEFSYWCIDKSKDIGLIYAYKKTNI